MKTILSLIKSIRTYIRSVYYKLKYSRYRNFNKPQPDWQFRLMLGASMWRWRIESYWFLCFLRPALPLCDWLHKRLSDKFKPKLVLRINVETFKQLENGEQFKNVIQQMTGNIGMKEAYHDLQKAQAKTEQLMKNAQARKYASLRIAAGQ